ALRVSSPVLGAGAADARLAPGRRVGPAQRATLGEGRLRPARRDDGGPRDLRVPSLVEPRAELGAGLGALARLARGGRAAHGPLRAAGAKLALADRASGGVP